LGISPYLKGLRERIGHELVLLPAVAVLPWDEAGRLLMVRESQTGLWRSRRQVCAWRSIASGA
jgi:8-oxo-dGTP diphosphatase